VRKRAEAQQKEFEAGQKDDSALDVGVVCARLFGLLQAPESSHLQDLEAWRTQETD